jgi:DNA-binding transcriptional ArsR family regulator
MPDHQLGQMRATAHPLRLRMMNLLINQALSAAEVARELDITHANASYHLRTLAAAGLLTVAGEEKIRGGVAKRYQHPWNQTKMIAADSSPEDYGAYVAAMAQEMTRRYGSRRRPGTLVDAELWVSPEVWAEVRALVVKASKLIHAEAQPPRSPGSMHVNLTTAAFVMDEADPAPPA